MEKTNTVPQFIDRMEQPLENPDEAKILTAREQRFANHAANRDTFEYFDDWSTRTQQDATFGMRRHG